MSWDIAPACTEISQPYSCVDWDGEWKCPNCGPGRTFHAGIDLSGPASKIFRSPVLATRSGVVNAVGIDFLGDQAVAIRSDEGPTIEYGHLDEARVAVGQRVKVGDLLGLLGSKGRSTGPHLHIEVRIDGPVQGVTGCPQNDPTRNPVPYLRASYKVAGLDSSFFRPTRTQALQAKAAGISFWGGYIATKGGVGLASPWDKASFDNVRVFPGKPVAWASGWDDPVACKKLAAEWDVRLGLDDEAGIRAGLMAEPERTARARYIQRVGPRRVDGSWVQPWLDQSGAGLYGPASVHVGRRAPFHVIAAYPSSDPGTVWPNNVERPDEPVGWQFQGTHDEFGGAVDRGWYESWFLGAGGEDLQADERDALFKVLAYISDVHGGMSDAMSFVAGRPEPAIPHIQRVVDGLAGRPQLDPKAVAAEVVKQLPPGSSVDTNALAKAIVREFAAAQEPPS